MPILLTEKAAAEVKEIIKSQSLPGGQDAPARRA
jgi:hypothetical protein